MVECLDLFENIAPVPALADDGVGMEHDPTPEGEGSIAIAALMAKRDLHHVFIQLLSCYDWVHIGNSRMQQKLYRRSLTISPSATVKSWRRYVLRLQRWQAVLRAVH